MTESFLKVCGTKIMDGKRPVRLHGVNLGGWLMPEGYIVHAPNRGVRYFREGFARAMGEKSLNDLQRAFRDNFIRETDLDGIKRLGFNCIRLPFHYSLIEKRPFQYSVEGVLYLDRLIRWVRARGMYVILDMHAVPGAQNQDWHSDSDGRALFWSSPLFQKRAIALWEYLADRYKDEPAVAGFDLLNEAVLDDAGILNKYYQALIKAIRASDKQHIIFVEGNRWAQDIACLDDFKDDNLALSIHFYEPLELTFNFVMQTKYPLVSRLGRWDKAVMKKRLEGYRLEADRRQRPLYCGEFGVNARGGVYEEDKWVKDVLSVFREFDIHWTYWTWKAVKNYMFPDGIMSYGPNVPWVNRPGPLSGWETWHLYWKKHKSAMIDSWKSEAFTLNNEIAVVLKKAA